jgi:hypothetical protein
LEQALLEFQAAQPVPPTLTAIVQTAMRNYLATSWYIPPSEPLQITPMVPGSGKTDVSVNHDRYHTEIAEPEHVSQR